MAQRIDIDLERVRQVADGLSLLHAQLSTTAATALTTGAHSGLGTPRSLGAVRDFVDDWSVRRGRLLESIEAVGTMAEQTATAFTQVDDDLAASIAPAQPVAGTR